MTVRFRRWGTPLGVVVAAIVGGCDALTDANGVGALDFTGIPFPAVVTGDTMRDSTGAAAPLTAIVYDADGDIIAGAPVQFIALDTGVTITAQGYLIATARDGGVRLVASVDGLQSQDRVVRITRQPDTIVVTGDTVVSYNYAIPDKSSNVSPTLAFTLKSSDTVGVSPNVAGWAVRWRVLHNGDTLGIADTTLVALWDGSGSRHSLRDTTGTDGVSSRRLRIYANQLTPQPDSFIVVAEVRARGAHVPGSPVRFVVNTAPPTVP